MCIVFNTYIILIITLLPKTNYLHRETFHSSICNLYVLDFFLFFLITLYTSHFSVMFIFTINNNVAIRNATLPEQSIHIMHFNGSTFHLCRRFTKPPLKDHNLLQQPVQGTSHQRPPPLYRRRQRTRAAAPYRQHLRQYITRPVTARCRQILMNGTCKKIFSKDCRIRTAWNQRLKRLFAWTDRTQKKKEKGSQFLKDV